MTGPTEPNVLPVDFDVANHYGDQIEVEHAHTLNARPGKVRVLAWRNRAKLARFDDALAWLKAHPAHYSTPEALYAVRNTEQFKYGLGINVEQELSDNAGFFLRWMQADGKTETHAFTEVDGSLSTGVLVKGAAWGRAQDTAGLALARNTLSDDRRRFLEAGGTSFFIGDGGINYRPETIVEAFYSWSLEGWGLGKKSWLTVDYQNIQNPAYNADRGPMHVLAFRFHAQY